MVQFKVEGPVVFTPTPGLWTRFTQSPNGTVGSDLRKRGNKLAELSRRSVARRSGAVAASIGTVYTATSNPFVTVSARDRHAYFLHEGTRPHTITANNHRMLRFKVKGRVVYVRTVKHPGTRPTKFMTRHLPSVIL